MRLNTSTVLVSLLVLSQAEAGPLRIGRILRREEVTSVAATTSGAIPTASAFDGDSGDNVSAADRRGGSGRGGGENEESEGGITDPQEFPDATPSPEITTLIIDRTTADVSPPETTAEVSSTADGVDETTAPETTLEATSTSKPSDDPSSAPEDDKTQETTLSETATSQPVSSEDPSDTSNADLPTETPSSDPEAEPTSTEVDPDTQEGTTTVVEELTTTAIETVSPTDPPSPGKGKGKGEETATATSTEEPATETGSTGSGPASDGPSSTAETATGAEESATGTSTGFTSAFGSSATETGTPSTNTEAGAGEATGTPPASDAPEEPATPDKGGAIPTLIERPATTSVSPETLATLIQLSNEYNQNFASLKPDTPCQGTQVACVEGNIGRCQDGVFAIERCSQGNPCVALPMDNAPVVELRCVDKAAADKILNPEGTAPGGDATETGGAPRVTVTVTATQPATVIMTSEVTVPASPLPSTTEDAPEETPSPTETPEVPDDDTPGAPLPSEPVVFPTDVLDVIPIGESRAPKTTVETTVLSAPSGGPGQVTVSITIMKEGPTVTVTETVTETAAAATGS